jgi:hypothetical protein
MTVFLPPSKQASEIALDTANFDKKLAVTDDQVQDLATKFDEHTHSIAEITGLAAATVTVDTLVSKGVNPVTDDLYDLGSPGLRWDDIYATNGVIQTSDENLKEQIVPLKGNLKLINELVPVSYKFLSGTRTHWGFSAQYTEKVVGDVALIVKSDDCYGLRYTELIAPAIGAIQELTRHIEDIEDTLVSKMYIADADEVIKDIELKLEHQAITNGTFWTKIEESLNRPVPEQIIRHEVVREIPQPVNFTKVYLAACGVGLLVILDIIVHLI